MNLLENRILAEGKIFPGNILKVDSFLNHQIDPILIKQMGKEIADHFMNKEVTKVVTIETSGIAIALTTAFELGVPMVFAKKTKGQNMSDSVYVSHVFSYTKKTESTITIDKQYLNSKDKVLIVDDFLATGQALLGLMDICTQAKAEVSGCGIGIEKVFQGGGNKIREKGYDIYSLAKINHFEKDRVVFENE